MRRYFLSILLLLGLLAVPVPLAAQSTSGTITTAGADCSVETRCVVVGVRGYPSLGVYVDVGTSGTFNFEATINGTDWFSINDDVGAASSLAADGAVFFTNPGYAYVRIRASAIDGDASVVAFRGFAGLKSTATLAGEAQGDGAIQDGANNTIEATVTDLANSNPLTVAITDANGDQITSFGGGTQYATGDAQATPTGTGALGFDGTNLRILSTNSSGNLQVVFASAQAVTDGGDSLTVDGTLGALQSGTWTVQPGNTANTTPWLFTITQSGNAAAVNASGQLSVTCANCSSSGVSVNEDVASANADPGTPAYAIRRDTPINSSGAEGDYEPLQMSAGRLWVSAIIGTANASEPNHSESDPVGASFDLNGNLRVFLSNTTFQAEQSGTWTTRLADTSGNGLTSASAGSNRPLDVIINDTNGNRLDPTADVVHDAAQTMASAAGPMIMGRASASAPTDVSANDDAVAAWMGMNGQLATMLVDANGDAVAVSGGTQYTHNAAQATPIGTIALGYDGANVRALATDSSGNLQAEVLTMPTVTVTATNLDIQSGGADLATASAQSTGNSALSAIQTAVQLIDDDQVGATPAPVASLLSNNATNVKASAGRLLSMHLVNTTDTIYYIRFYNLATSPTCSSATGYLFSMPVPASTSGAGFSMNFGPTGLAFGTGIGYCITAGAASTNDVSAAVGIYGVVAYK